MSEDLFYALYIFNIALLLVLYVTGIFLLPIMEYKKTKSISRFVLHFFMHAFILVVLAIVGIMLMHFFNELLQGLFNQNILSLPVRALSIITTWFILILPILIFRKRMSRYMFVYYLGTAVILCITIAFALFPYKASLWYQS